MAQNNYESGQSLPARLERINRKYTPHPEEKLFDTLIKVQNGINTGHMLVDKEGSLFDVFGTQLGKRMTDEEIDTVQARAAERGTKGLYHAGLLSREAAATVLDQFVLPTSETE